MLVKFMGILANMFIRCLEVGNNPNINISLEKRVLMWLHYANEPSTYIDEVLFEAFAKVFYEGSLAGVVLQQDKVLHTHTVSGCQGRLHHSPHPVTSHYLEEDKQRGGGVSD